MYEKDLLIYVNEENNFIYFYLIVNNEEIYKIYINNEETLIWPMKRGRYYNKEKQEEAKKKNIDNLFKKINEGIEIIYEEEILFPNEHKIIVFLGIKALKSVINKKELKNKLKEITPEEKEVLKSKIEKLEGKKINII